MRARVPASSANLGPGFDTLAVALQLYVEVEVRSARRLEVHAEGEGADLPADATHMAARVAAEVVGHDRLAITVRSAIPVGRGLGSSASLALAAAAAAGAPDPLAAAVKVDGHAENAAASFAGGLVAATTIDGRPYVVSLELDPAYRFVLLVPERRLPTAEARAALPATVGHADAAFNLGRLAILIAGLADHRRLVAAAAEDRLHQPQRSKLFPEASELMAGLVDAGAMAACWSGAGPSILGICLADGAPALRERAEALLGRSGVKGVALLVDPDRGGLQVTET